MEGTRRPKSSFPSQARIRVSDIARDVSKNKFGRRGYSLHCRQKNRVTAFHPFTVTGIDRRPAPLHRRWRFHHMRTFAQTAHDLATGTSSRSLVEECLTRILDPAGEARRPFLKVHPDHARLAPAYFH